MRRFEPIYLTLSKTFSYSILLSRVHPSARARQGTHLARFELCPRTHQPKVSCSVSSLSTKSLLIIIDIITSCHHHHNSKMCIGWLMVGCSITWFSDLQNVSVSSSSSNHHAKSALSRSRAILEDTSTEETLPTPTAEQREDRVPLLPEGYLDQLYRQINNQKW